MVKKDKESSKKISAEIETLKQKAGDLSQQQVAGAATAPAQQPEQPTSTEQAPLDLNKPAAQLPTQSPQEPIEGPSISPVPTGEATVTPTPGQ
jgi:hypothetical protein